MLLGGDGHGHQVLSPAAQTDAVAEGIVPIAAGQDIQSRSGRTRTQAFHRRLPIHAKSALILLAHHDFGAVDKGAAHDGMDRLRAKTCALAQHIIADGRKGRPINQALVHIVAKRIQFAIDLHAEGRIRHHPLEVVADGIEGRLRVRPLIQCLFQHVDEHLTHLVFGFHDQDGILLGKVAQIFCRRLGQLENARDHSFQVLFRSIKLTIIFDSEPPA